MTSERERQRRRAQAWRLGRIFCERWRQHQEKTPGRTPCPAAGCVSSGPRPNGSAVAPASSENEPREQAGNRRNTAPEVPGTPAALDSPGPAAIGRSGNTPGGPAILPQAPLFQQRAGRQGAPPAQTQAAHEGGKADKASPGAPAAAAADSTPARGAIRDHEIPAEGESVAGVPAEGG